MSRTIRNTGLIPLAFALLGGLATPSHAQTDGPIRVGIIVDDMGYSRPLGEQALALPGPVSYSFLPDTPHALELAQRARAGKRDVLLHLPMQGRTHRLREPATLTGELDETRFRERVRRHIEAIPHIVGVNNHMGSQLTPLTEQMGWLMEEIAGRDLFFIDSRTTHLTVATDSAAEHGVRFSQRDVFLDNQKDPAYIRAAFRRFINLARERGGAIAIAHPHPVTLDVLDDLIETLPANLQLAGVSELLDQGTRREPTRLVDAESVNH